MSERLTYLKSLLETSGIFSYLREADDGNFEMAFANTDLKGLMFVFNEDGNYIAADYVGEPIDA